MSSNKNRCPLTERDVRFQIGQWALSDVRFEIGETGVCPIWNQTSDNEFWIEIEEDVRFQKKRKKREKSGSLKNEDQWSDPYGARLAPGLKPLCLPRVHLNLYPGIWVSGGVVDFGGVAIWVECIIGLVDLGYLSVYAMCYFSGMYHRCSGMYHRSIWVEYIIGLVDFGYVT